MDSKENTPFFVVDVGPDNLWRRERGPGLITFPPAEAVGGQSLDLMQALLKTVREYPQATNEASVCGALRALEALIECDPKILEGC